ncbi:hypothetical protein BASA62_007912 [Batrachochytrium salamandrivorans]|nr:hypothetical protein BASA62_007912 [Batrachochytrium salamandrivorans]
MARIETRDFSPCTQCTESGALFGSPTHLCKRFPYAKPGDLRKAMQGARIRTSAVRDIRWISRQVVQLLVDADYVSAFTRIITSLDATIVKSFKAWIPRPEAADKDKARCYLVVLLQRRSRPSNAVLTSKQGISSDLCSHLLVARPSRQPLLRRPRFGFKHPVLTYPHWRQSQRSLSQSRGD